ncbi:hypothetical protein LRAMOSA09924 [Lichtheimia ramosa]|uniref:Uncharacterized protein n=1 Tax=Lichtheimia ramosa TaxID=688394 RepID=A0A077WN72_9FUNG|nr:hypothetical protein LRAMOSA09924 [Lichtheimia ramosa]
MKIQLGLTLTMGAAMGVFAAQEYCNSGYAIPNTEYSLDLSKLNKPFTIVQNETHPPALTSKQVLLNICDAVERPEGTDEEDFCKKGAYVCYREFFVKHDKQDVMTVKNVAGDFGGKDKLNPQFKATDTSQDLTQSGAQFSLTLNGGKYKGNDDEKETAQSAQLTLECDTSQSRNDDPQPPTLVSYQNNVMSLNWKTVYACATKKGEEPPPSEPNNPEQGGSEGMSGLGIFFTIVFVLLGVYFVGGAFYNYKVYNARGLDLIPHRDFWLDLPYLIKDLISHVIDTIMSHRRGSGGYVAV